MSEESNEIETVQDETTERSLLEEIEDLDVIEASEFQEGVAFHAFRFISPK